MKENINIQAKDEDNPSKKKHTWQDPEIIILDINETEGGNDSLFEDESGIAS